MGDRYVLLVEDCENDIFLAERAFQKCEVLARLVVARDGSQALDLLLCRNEHSARDPRDMPALVILDLKLPFLDGLEVLRALRSDQSTADLPVVVLTSSLERHDQAECLKLRANSYLRKPVEFNQFLSLVRQLKNDWL